MMWLYRLFTGAAWAAVFPYGRLRAGQGSVFWQGRMGDLPEGPIDVWLHAASVGEVAVIGHLIHWLHKQRPELRLLLTTMTEQGYLQASRAWAEADVRTAYFPLDAAPVMRRVMARVRPRLIVIAETEIWPNLVTAADREAVPLVLVNGRLSEKAAGRYRMISGSMRALLSTYKRLFLKTEADRQRFADLGVSGEKLIVGGDMKFDAPLQVKTSLETAALRAEVGFAETDFALVAGSTRPGEEELLLPMYKRLRESHANLRLLLAPRHLVRLPEVEGLIDSHGLPHYRFGDARPGETEFGSGGVVVVDRMGLLNDLYAAADLAFVGGTLVDIGGHNILEPVWAGTPVVYGPSLSNVEEAAAYIAAHRYGQMVESIDAMAGVLEAMIEAAHTGRKIFAVKHHADIEQSATAVAGAYLLECLDHA